MDLEIQPLIRERLSAERRSRNDSQWPNEAIPAAMMAPAGLPLEGARPDVPNTETEDASNDKNAIVLRV